MKKVFTVFSVILFLFITLPSNAAGEYKSLTQGMYNITDAKLQPGISYKVRNTSTSKSLLLIIDTNQSIQQLMRIEPTSPEYILKPLNSSDMLIVIGAGKLEFY
jgi:adenylate kinase